MKTLYLLRHAKAEPGGKDINDRDRALSQRGRAACALVGGAMKAKRYVPDFVLASSSARTKETLAHVAEAMGMNLAHRFENTLYLADPEEVVRMVQELADGVASAMVVGHNPGMHHLALLLSEPARTKPRVELELKFPTCALAVLRFNVKRWSDIVPGGGTLIDFMTPEEL